MTGEVFNETRWTLVGRVGKGSDEGRRALSELCEIYYEPVYRFIFYRTKNDAEARDLTHSFFEDLITRESLGAPDPERGRFRSYLLGAVKHFLSREGCRRNAAKRGGKQERVELTEAIPAEEFDDRLFDRDWALALIRRAHDTVEREMTKSGKAEQFEILRAWLDGSAVPPREQAAAKLQMSEAALKVAIFRLRQKFRECVRAEVRSTLMSEDSLEDEFRYLIEVITKS